jgi:hypothetical protein
MPAIVNNTRVESESSEEDDNNLEIPRLANPADLRKVLHITILPTQPSDEAFITGPTESSAPNWRA